MDIRQLETFICVAENKSFTKAAELLYVTQPTVSNHVSNLEKELDTILFIRTRRSVNLTKSGMILYSHAQNIISAYHNLSKDLKSFNQNLEGHLNIYASTVPRKYFLPDILRTFSHDYPGVSYSLVSDDSQFVINSLIRGETDFGFVGMKIESSKLVYHEVMEDELVLLTSTASKINSKDGLHISYNDLKNLKLILREEGSGTRNLFEKALIDKDLSLEQLQNATIIEDSGTIVEMVRAGIGSTIISKHEAKLFVETGLLKQYYVKDLDLTRFFYFVYNSDRQYVPINKIFTQFVLDANLDK